MGSLTKNKKTRAELPAMVERAFPGLTLATAEDAVAEPQEGWFKGTCHLGLMEKLKRVNYELVWPFWPQLFFTVK